jgi:putative membrane protein
MEKTMTRLLAIVAGGLFLFGVAGLRAEDTKPGQKPFDDAEFVKIAASDGMHEVALGKIAEGKAKTEPVKSFAERMVKDHTKIGEDLKKAASSAGIPLPEMMSEKDQKHVEHFQSYKGTNFDGDYMKHMISDHEAAVALFTKASQEAKNPAIKDFAAKTLPTVQEHLKLAKKTVGQE